jgi:hypothetical protein
VLMRGEAKSSGHQVEGQAAAVDPFIILGYALCTKSHCQQLANNQIAAKGFQVVLPKTEA